MADESAKTPLHKRLTALNTNLATIAGFTGKVDVNSAELQETKERLDSLIGALEQRFAYVETAQANLQSKVDELCRSLSEIHDEQLALKSDVGMEKTEIVKISETIQAIKEDFSKLSRGRGGGAHKPKASRRNTRGRPAHATTT